MLAGLTDSLKLQRNYPGEGGETLRAVWRQNTMFLLFLFVFWPTCFRPPRVNDASPPEFRGTLGVPRTSIGWLYTTYRATSSPSPYKPSSFEV